MIPDEADDLKGLVDTPKDQVRAYWEHDPCGADDAGTLPVGTPDFYRAVEERRYRLDDFMHEVVDFRRWSGKRMLEVGCGLGTDALQFARGGARYFGVDLTRAAASLTRRRLRQEDRPGPTAVADVERLPYGDDTYDLVYSWGVIHHTPDPAAAARELVRVCRPGGTVLVMVYNRRSLVALQTWGLYGLLRGKPFRTPAELIAEHMESPGTASYTPAEAAQLFPDLEDVEVRPVVTRFDLRVGRRLFLPGWLRKLVPSGLGWYLVVSGRKPA